MVVKLERPERYITNRDLDFIPRRNPLELRHLQDMGETVTFDGTEYPRTGPRFISPTITKGEAIRRLNPTPAQVMSEEEVLQNLRDRRAAELIDLPYGEEPTNLGISPRIDPTALLQDISQPSLRLPGQVSDVTGGMSGTDEFLRTAVSDLEGYSADDVRSGPALRLSQSIINLQEALGEATFNRDVNTLLHGGDRADFPIGTGESNPNLGNVDEIRRRWYAILSPGGEEIKSTRDDVEQLIRTVVEQGSDGNLLADTARDVVEYLQPPVDRPRTTVDTGYTDLASKWISDESPDLDHVKRTILDAGMSLDDPRVQFLLNNPDNRMVKWLVRLPEFRRFGLPLLDNLGRALGTFLDNKTRDEVYEKIGETVDAPAEVVEAKTNEVYEILSNARGGMEVLKQAWENEAQSGIEKGVRVLGEQWGVAEDNILQAIPLLNRYFIAGTMALRNMPEEMRNSIDQGLLDLTGRGAQEWANELKSIGVQALEPGGMFGEGGAVDQWVGGAAANLDDFGETIKGQANEFYGRLEEEGPKVIKDALDAGNRVAGDAVEKFQEDVLPYVRDVGTRARDGLVNSREIIQDWVVNNYGRADQPESFDVSGAVSRGDRVAGADVVGANTRNPQIHRSAPPNTQTIQSAWTPAVGERTASLVENAVIDGANAAGNMNTANARQSTGALDYFLGGSVADSVRDFIGYNEPFWQEPGTGILSVLQNWPTDAPWGSTCGTDMGRAGQSARASAAASSLAGFEAETARMDAETKRLDALAAMSTAGKQTLSGPIIQASERLQLGMAGLDTITQYENLLNTNQIGGVAPWTIDKLKKVGNLLGFDLGESGIQAAERFRNHIMTSWEFWTGTSLNATERKLLDKIVPEGGLFKGDAAAYEALQLLKRRLESSNATQVKILQGSGWSELLPTADLIASGPGINE